MKAVHAAVMAVALAFGSGQAFGQEHAEAEHRAAVLEIGAAGEWGIPGGNGSFGPSVGLAVTPIEHLLEIEFGVSPMINGGVVDWKSEIIFKRPFELSKNLELMVGVGPGWSMSTNTVSAIAMLDLMYWTTPQYGWFVEPSYSYAFNGEHEKNLGLKVGLLIALPAK